MKVAVALRPMICSAARYLKGVDSGIILAHCCTGCPFRLALVFNPRMEAPPVAERVDIAVVDGFDFSCINGL